MTLHLWSQQSPIQRKLQESRSWKMEVGGGFVCMMLLCCDLCWRRGIWLGVTRGKWRIWFSHSDLQCGKFCRKSSENGSENQSFNWKSESGHLTVKANKCNHRDQLISNKNIFTKVKIFAHVWKIFYPPCHLRAAHWAAWWRGRGLGQGRWRRGGEAGARPRQCGHWIPSPACKPTPDIFQHSFDILHTKLDFWSQNKGSVEMKQNELSVFCWSTSHYVLIIKSLLLMKINTKFQSGKVESGCWLGRLGANILNIIINIKAR